MYLRLPIESHTQAFVSNLIETLLSLKYVKLMTKATTFLPTNSSQIKYIGTYN